MSRSSRSSVRSTPSPIAPAAREEAISGPFLEDGTLLKPVSVDTTVPDGKDLLRRHKVKSGETLASLSKKYKVDKATIFWASKLTKIKLRPGQKLTIPPVNGLVVKVKSTDTLKSLARKYKVKSDAILEANKLEDSNLVMGQVLVLPGAKGKPLPKPKPKPGRLEVVLRVRRRAPAQYRGGRFGWPVAGGELSQGYHCGHYGIDIAADPGTPARAASRRQGHLRRLEEQRWGLPGLDRAWLRPVLDLQPHVVADGRERPERRPRPAGGTGRDDRLSRPVRTSTSRSGAGRSGTAASGSTRSTTSRPSPRFAGPRRGRRPEPWDNGRDVPRPRQDQRPCR